MMCPLLLVLAALGYGVLVLGALFFVDLFTWHENLQAYRLSLPRAISIDDAVRWFGSLAAMTHPPRWSLVRLNPIVLEVHATSPGSQHLLSVGGPTGRAAF